MKNIHIALALILMVVPAVAGACSGAPCDYPDVDRESKIPAGQVKITPETDVYPPILHSDEYEQPVPMPYPINTAGAEDSGFISRMETHSTSGLLPTRMYLRKRK